MPQSKFTESQDKNASVRLTTISGGQTVTQKQLYKGIFYLSLQSFGNQHMQIQQFSQKIVRDYRWLTTSQINQIKNLCWALPGPTLYQMIITITTLKLQSPWAGFISFIILNIPAWTILFILGTLADIYVSDKSATQVKLAFLGFNAATAGVMVRSLAEYFQQNSKNISTILIMLCSTGIFWYFRSTSSIIFCMISGAIFSLYIQIQSKTQMSQKSKNLFHRLNNSIFMGKNAIIIFVVIFIILWFIANYYPDEWFSYAYIFYFCGSFVLGPATTVFAYLYAFFMDLQLIPESLIWIGFPFSFLTPGSVVNGALYYGVLLDGFRGLIVASIFFYLPCFASLYGILPQWKYYRSKPGVQRLTKGLTCVSVGLAFAMVILSLQHCAKIDLSSTFTIFIVSCFLNYVWGYYSFLIILIGGLLANVRRWGLIYYRFMPDHPY